MQSPCSPAEFSKLVGFFLYALAATLLDLLLSWSNMSLGGVPDTYRHQEALYFLSEQKQHHRLSNLRQIIFYFDPR